MIFGWKKHYLWGVSKLEKGLKIDARFFVKANFYGVLQQIVGLTSGLVIAYAFGHYASKFLFGEYNLALSVIALFNIVSLPGINTSLMRSVGRGFDSSHLRAVKARFKWSLLGIPLLIGASIYYRTQQSDVLPGILIVAALFFPFLYGFQSTSAFFQAKKRFDLQALFSSISSVITAILVTSAIVFTQNLLLVLGGYLVGLSLPSVFSFIYSKTLIKKETKNDPDLLPYGKFLTVLQILPTIESHLGNIILAGFLGVDKLAVFIVATKFPGIIQKNFDVFYKPITAKLAAQSEKEHWQTLKIHGYKFLLIGLGMFGLIWLFIPMLIGIFYSQQYAEAVKLARLYALGLLPLPLSWVISNIITYQKHKKFQLFSSTVLPIAKLGAYFIVIPRWQIMGLIMIMLTERYIVLISQSIYLLFVKYKYAS